MSCAAPTYSKFYLSIKYWRQSVSNSFPKVLQNFNLPIFLGHCHFVIHFIKYWHFSISQYFFKIENLTISEGFKLWGEHVTNIFCCFTDLLSGQRGVLGYLSTELLTLSNLMCLFLERSKFIFQRFPRTPLPLVLLSLPISHLLLNSSQPDYSLTFMIHLE